MLRLSQKRDRGSRRTVRRERPKRQERLRGGHPLTSGATGVPGSGRYERYNAEPFWTTARRPFRLRRQVMRLYIGRSGNESIPDPDVRGGMVSKKKSFSSRPKNPARLTTEVTTLRLRRSAQEPRRAEAHNDAVRATLCL